MMKIQHDLLVLNVLMALLVALTAPAWANVEAPPEEKDNAAPPPPMQIEVAPLVTRLLEDPVTSEDERQSLRLFHGQWDALDVDELSIAERAHLALLRYELHDSVFETDEVPRLIRAKAALAAGRPEEAVTLLQHEASRAEMAVVLATALEQLGRIGEAAAALHPVRDQLMQEPAADATELTAAAQALSILARLEGRPARDYQLAMNLLGTAREQDPLYWPTHVAEGKLLIEKDNRADGGAALLEALALNPQAGPAWYELGLLAVDGFDFDRARQAVDKLREINPQHPLADRLQTRSLLQQRDVDGARAIIESQLAQHPQHRQWIALLAAAEALSFDEEQTQATLDRYDELSPGSPDAHYLVGSVLSAARQYDWGETVLRQAIERQPNWPAAWIELGLLLMQAGDLPAAREALAQAARLDPFNRRASNQLSLARDLLSYETLETEHFIIRYKPGIDQVLVRDMPDELERLYRDITRVFQHRPAAKTQIDIMPDERHFGVRITGMPEIWTIAAATGDVLSMTPPREGPRQRGPYHWVNVLRHEYVHTVTLSQTDNRIPHWFTEACAVSQETTGRTYQTCQLLAWALHNDELFDLNEINWGFVRPQTPRDRPLAYAQADWMLEYLAVEFGHDAILRLLDLYRDGTPDQAAMRQVTGVGSDAFMEGFRTWARGQVRAWGLEPRDNDEGVQQALQSEEPVDPQRLTSLLKQQPDHPDLLRLAAELALQTGDATAAQQAVLRYAAVRPVDPWPHRAMVQLASQTGDLEQAVASLQQLDLQDTYNSAWSHQLARIHRQAGRLDQAYQAIRRALYREPYNASYRTLAATVALQQGATDDALHHLEALPLLEPDRAVHHTRLAALYHRLGRSEDAAAAATRARALQPDAPVEAFLP